MDEILKRANLGHPEPSAYKHLAMRAGPDVRDAFIRNGFNSIGHQGIGMDNLPIMLYTTTNPALPKILKQPATQSIQMCWRSLILY